jgi:hypothetical protein
VKDVSAELLLRAAKLESVTLIKDKKTIKDVKELRLYYAWNLTLDH